MGVEQVVTCDHCGVRLNSDSVLDAVLVQATQVNGPIQVFHYGLVCGCGQGALAALKTLTPEPPADTTTTTA